MILAMASRLLLALAVAGTAAAVPVTFNNLAPRLDVNGTIVNGHDGPTVRFSPVSCCRARGIPQSRP
jgi:hypothetical protein